MAVKPKMCVRCDLSPAIRPIRPASVTWVTSYCRNCWNQLPSNKRNWSSRTNPKRRETNKWCKRSMRRLRKLEANAL